LIAASAAGRPRRLARQRRRRIAALWLRGVNLGRPLGWRVAAAGGMIVSWIAVGLAVVALVLALWLNLSRG
jgi:hypothetical protein